MVREATPEEIETHVEKTGGELPPGHIPTTEQDGGLSALTPEGTRITLNRREFTITEMLAGQLLAVSADVAEFGIAFQGIGKDDLPLIMAIVTSRMDIVLRIAATVLDVDVAFVEKAKASELLAFCRAFYKENADFFRQLWELLPETYRNRTGAEGAGAQPEAATSEAATVETTHSENSPASEAGTIGST